MWPSARTTAATFRRSCVAHQAQSCGDVPRHSLLERFTVNKVNFVLDVENNSKNVETKFHGRRISIDEVIRSINVNFLFFRSIFLLGQFLLSLLFCAILLYTQKEMTQII